MGFASQLDSLVSCELDVVRCEMHLTQPPTDEISNPLHHTDLVIPQFGQIHFTSHNIQLTTDKSVNATIDSQVLTAGATRCRASALLGDPEFSLEL
jgi:hypothetical protein